MLGGVAVFGFCYSLNAIAVGAGGVDRVLEGCKGCVVLLTETRYGKGFGMLRNGRYERMLNQLQAEAEVDCPDMECFTLRRIGHVVSGFEPIARREMTDLGI